MYEKNFVNTIEKNEFYQTCQTLCQWWEEKPIAFQGRSQEVKIRVYKYENNTKLYLHFYQTCHTLLMIRGQGNDKHLRMSDSTLCVAFSSPWQKSGKLLS